MIKIKNEFRQTCYVTEATWAKVEEHQAKAGVDLLEFTCYDKAVEDFKSHHHQCAAGKDSPAKPHRWSKA